LPWVCKIVVNFTLTGFKKYFIIGQLWLFCGAKRSLQAGQDRVSSPYSRAKASSFSAIKSK
jgi:hypothetical protein